MKKFLIKFTLILGFFINPCQAKTDWQQVNCLSTAIYKEARGESIRGKEAIALVIMNRSKSPKYPSKPCDIIKQPMQFPWYAKGGQDVVNLLHGKDPSKQPLDRFAWYEANLIAWHAYKGNLKPLKGVPEAMYFNTVQHQWAKTMPKVKIGKHWFY